MQIISLSVDGIKQAAGRGLFDWLKQQPADIVCLQDLRASEDQLDSPVYFPEGYHAYFCDTGDGRNGVALYAREMPRAVMMGFGYSEDVDLDGSYIRADFDQFSVVSLLAPKASTDPQSLENRIRYLDCLQSHLQKISNKRRKYIFCGNWQIAHQKVDVQNWEANQASPGFLPFERQWLSQLYNELGYVDVQRSLTSDSDIYSWWPSGEIGKGDGWRVDTQVASPELAACAYLARFCPEQPFSSHAPLIINYDTDSL